MNRNPPFFAGHELRLVDVASGETVKTLGPIGSLSNLVVAAKANRLIVSAHDRMRVYDMATWNELHQAPAKSRRLPLHADGRKVVYRNAKQLVIKDIVTHETVATLPHSAEDYEGTPSEIVGIAFSPDGRWLAVSNKNDVVILDVATGSTVHRLQGHTGLVYSIAFSPDGRSIATGANDRSIRIWDTRDFKEVIALRGHSDHVQTVLWSADGERLYSSSGDYTVRLWDTLSRRERLSLPSLKR